MVTNRSFTHYDVEQCARTHYELTAKRPDLYPPEHVAVTAIGSEWRVEVSDARGQHLATYTIRSQNGRLSAIATK